MSTFRRGRWAVLRHRHFRRFFVAYGMSLIGTSMSAMALIFAILGGGGTPSMLGAVRAVEIGILVVLLLYGGVVGDRLPRRAVMLTADVMRCAAQGVLAAAGFALPPLTLALRAATPLLMAAAVVAGVGSAINSTLYSTTTARRIAPELRSRIGAYTTMGSFAPGAVGLALAGPAASLLGTSRVFWFGAIWQVVGCCLLLALPEIRAQDPTIGR
jgi:MFS family permease